MIRKVLAVAVAAGLLAGIAMAVLLEFTTTPLILKAEVYERAAHATEGKSVRVGAPSPGSLVLSTHGDHAHSAPAPAAKAEDEGWQPAEGFQRTAFTSVATIAVALGYALILMGCMIAAREPIDPRSALLWGLAGFAATGLAPALGLAPELPGSAAADLMLRQGWWVATSIVTAVGLYFLIKKPQASAKLAGAALVAAPHLVGAPQPSRFESTAPAELAAAFAASSLAMHALLWALVGLLVGWFWKRISDGAPRTAAS